jgi:hypothetical protein
MRYLFAHAQLLRSYDAQWPSIKGDHHSTVKREIDRIDYTQMDLLLISFLYRST